MYFMLRFVIWTQHLQIQCFPMTIKDVLMLKSEKSDQLSSVWVYQWLLNSPDSSEYVKGEGDCERAEVTLTDLHGDFGGVGGDARVVGFLLLGLLHAGGASAKITGLSLLGLATLLWSSGQKEKHWSCNTYKDFVCLSVYPEPYCFQSLAQKNPVLVTITTYIWSTTWLNSTNIHKTFQLQC